MKKMLVALTALTLVASLAAGVKHMAWANCSSPNVVPGGILTLDDPPCLGVKQGTDSFWHNEFKMTHANTVATIFQQSSECVNTAGTLFLSIDGGTPFALSSGFSVVITGNVSHTYHVTSNNISEAANGTAGVRITPNGESSRAFAWATFKVGS